MAMLLFAHGSTLGWLYATAAATAFGYHWFEQRRFYVLDHTLAWVCIAANFWLAWRTHDAQATFAGVFAVGLALINYRYARNPPASFGLLENASEHYDKYHTAWHVWCGVAGWFLAQGYVG